MPDGEIVRLSGLVTEIRAVHEGARFGSDVFLIADGVLPAEAFESAEVMTSPGRAGDATSRRCPARRCAAPWATSATRPSTSTA